MCVHLILAKQGQDDLCEAFFAYNRAKGTLYDGETRLFLRGSGKSGLNYLLKAQTRKA